MFGLLAGFAQAGPVENLMPMPASVKAGDGRFPVTSEFAIEVRDAEDPRVNAAADRLKQRWQARTGMTFAGVPQESSVVVQSESQGPAIPELGENESYSLKIDSTGVELTAPTSTGALRGLATLEQLLDSDTDGWFLPAVEIEDAPRFPWRGLMLDVCRHWQPMEVVKRTLDGMAAVKLNVLHLHLTEDQGFRIESRSAPKLHEMGSDGSFFTQEEMREIIAYAAGRGIRVVPEFDMPGHATSWLVSHPELGSRPGPYAIERKWGIFEPVLDPTNEEVYVLLDGFLGEMARLFPDPFLHIGGDEVKGTHWDANPQIQKFKREQKLNSNAELQTYFTQRVQEILAKHGKRMIGWDEILQPGLPTTAVIQSWRGPDSLAEAAKKGYSGILSNGYYIDLSYPASDHYLNDPLPEDASLSEEEARRILGGEATMWAEWVTPETIDSRIWPRTAAIAERLWSPRDTRDVDAMYRRLPVISLRLEEIGLRHRSYVDPLIRQFAGDEATPEDLRNLRAIADIIEPVKGYQRGQQQPNSTQLSPLTGFADIARPDSRPARELSDQIDKAIFTDASIEPAIDALAQWQAAAEALLDRRRTLSPRVQALTPLLERVRLAASIGFEAAGKFQSGEPASSDWMNDQLKTLEEAATPHDACELVFIPALRRLVVATANPIGEMSEADWRKHIDTLSASKEKQ